VPEASLVLLVGIVPIISRDDGIHLCHTIYEALHSSSIRKPPIKVNGDLRGASGESGIGSCDITRSLDRTVQYLH
jgi:hypothetical protein